MLLYIKMFTENFVGWMTSVCYNWRAMYDGGLYFLKRFKFLRPIPRTKSNYNATVYEKNIFRELGGLDTPLDPCCSLSGIFSDDWTYQERNVLGEEGEIKIGSW